MWKIDSAVRGRFELGLSSLIVEEVAAGHSEFGPNVHPETHEMPRRLLRLVVGVVRGHHRLHHRPGEQAGEARRRNVGSLAQGQARPTRVDLEGGEGGERRLINHGGKHRDVAAALVGSAGDEVDSKLVAGEAQDVRAK